MSPISRGFQGRRRSEVDPAGVPPGQYVTYDFPVLSAGTTSHAPNVDEGFCARRAKCTHRQGPLNEGILDGSTVTCPWHGTHFNVCTGAVLRGPAQDPLETYPVTVEGDVGRVDVPPAPAVQGAPRVD